MSDTKIPTVYGWNTFKENDDYESLKDPFLYLHCSTCDVTEGLPIDQQRTDFGCFIPHYDQPDSPDDCFYECIGCRIFGDITITVDENNDESWH